MDKKKTVKMRGKPLALAGWPVEVGERAPEFNLLDNDLAEKTFADYKGKILIISSVPSLDTPVCDLETRRFNQAAAGLGEDVTVLTVSMDLPFAQKRWCAAAGIDKVITLSDHRHGSFGWAYGVLIENLRLLARVVFVVDKEGIVRYIQIVDEVTEEPDYDDVLKAVEALRDDREVSVGSSAAG
jgi:thiol peroxidase